MNDNNDIHEYTFKWHCNSGTPMNICNDITKNNNWNSNTSMNSSTHGKSYVLRVYWWMIMVCEYRPYFYQMICEQHLSSHYAQKSQIRNVWKPFCTWCLKKTGNQVHLAIDDIFFELLNTQFLENHWYFATIYYWRKAR